MDTVDCIVVGAGVVGLAVARALALTGREVLVLEAADAIGTETSSRNSEVIHAGIYYPAGSFMARFCVAGKHALYRYCAERGVPHLNCGKLIVATSEEEAGKLASIQGRAAANGVPDLRMISGSEAREMEPALRCVAALVSPSTGIIDSHAYMLALQGDAEHAGAFFAFLSRVEGGRATNDGIVLRMAEMEVRAHLVVNAAGLHAPALARGIAGLPQEHVPTPYYAKGNYFSLTGRNPFSRLIYPVPVPGGLGTHLTVDMGGQARFGPDVEWVESPDYEVDPRRGDLFYESIRRWWPELRDGALSAGYAGIRPKIVPPSVAVQDFVIHGPSVHGVKGLINLFGIESPGLTASLAIADHVRAMAEAG